MGRAEGTEKVEEIEFRKGRKDGKGGGGRYGIERAMLILPSKKGGSTPPGF